MRTYANKSSIDVAQFIWNDINHLSDTSKIQLIKRISESLLKPKTEDDRASRKVFLSLAGAWNDDPKADAMDKAALSRHDAHLKREFNFD